MSEVESELQRILAELDRLNERLAAGELDRCRGDRAPRAGHRS